MSISCKGYGENVLTFSTNITGAGVPVAVNGNNSVEPAPADKDFIGITTYADGEIAGVFIDGYVEVPYTGTTPSFGFTALVSDGSNGVKTSTTSNHFVKVVYTDPAKRIVGFIL